MPEKQKKVHPKPEERAQKCLSGNELKNFSDFIEFLRDNKLSLQPGNLVVKHKNKSVCHVRFNDSEHSWEVRHSHFTRENWFQDYDKYITDDELKEFILAHINAPLCIDRGCNGRQNMTILGKHFDAVCNCWSLTVKNPDGAALECSKKLILVIKKFIADLAAASKV